jgi:pimeloyl-ACP methyl ester carboxylesterase
MRVRAGRRALVIALAACGLGGVGASPAAADLDWKQCSASSSFACGHLVVPLDRSGRVPGKITLAVRRRRAPVGDESVAVFALAGGPGQGATALADGLASVLGPVISSRDLIVFDQRGTGSSGALKCKAFTGHPVGATPPATLVAACAGQLGAGRGDYTTAASVADLEALRQATGYSKIVLYGTSYGTKVALDYARAYPDHVQSLLLDSVVSADGPDVFSRSSFHAVARVLRQMCTPERLCAHITTTPTADLARLDARLRRHALRAAVFDGHGRRHRVAIAEHDLFDILVAGDLDPTLRADFPAAVRSALHGDGAPMARLSARAASSEGSDGVDVPLFYSTYCEEVPFAWSRSAAPGARLAQLQGALDAVPSSAFAPFDRGVSLFESGALQCFDWPFASAAPQSSGPSLPDVPTLILSGADDLRTPTEDAQAVAAQIPGAKVEVVPFTGHSVLGSDAGKCAADAVQAFFAGRPVKPCTGEKLATILRPTPVAPRRLGDVRRYHGIPGRAGRTATAVALTVNDLSRQVAYQVSAISSLGQLADLRIGGLRGGYAQLTLSGLSLKRLVFVPGVTVSGSFTARRILLRIGGSAAAHGVLRGRPGHAVSGTLGGRRVRLTQGNPASAMGAAASAARVPRPGAGPVVP